MKCCRRPETEDGWKVLGWGSVGAQPCITGHFLPVLILLSSPLPDSFSILSITVRLWIPFAPLSAPPASHFLLFHFKVSFSLCLCHIMLFLMGLRWARMSHYNPKPLCAFLARAVRSGIYIHATCPITLTRWNPGSETRSSFTLFPSWLSDGCTQLAAHKKAVLLAWSNLPAVTALDCFPVSRLATGWAVSRPALSTVRQVWVLSVFVCRGKWTLPQILSQPQLTRWYFSLKCANLDFLCN